MLSAHDRDIIRRDHRLPGLATVLDPEIFADALRSALPDVTLEEPSVRYLRYKPGTNCLVAYRLKLDGRVSEVHAKAHRKDAFDKLHNALEKHRGESAMSPVIPSPLILEPMVAVYAFPSDRKLRALVKLADGAKRKRMLVKLLPGHLELHGARLRPLRYKPERRFVAQLVTAVGAQAVVKLYDNHDFPRARRGARVFRPAGPLALAPLLGGSSGQQALVWPWLSGRPLDQALRGARFNPASARTVGAALAALHAQKAESLEPLSRKEEIHSLFAAANALAFLLPELAARARRLALALASALMASPQQGCALHGDFSADQALLARGEAVLLDFDNAARGDPALDLGTFAAQLERNALHGTLPAARAGEVTEAVTAGYAEGRGDLPSRIGLYTAAGLLRLAPHGFRNREEDWPAKTEAVLTRAEALFEAEAPRGRSGRGRSGRGRKNPRVEVTDPFGVADDPALAFAAKALEPVAVTARLHEALGDPALELRGICVRRHKRGKRCLITYELTSAGGGLNALGKVRAKGTDRRTLRLQEALWRRGWDDDSADGISVAEPLGTVEAFRMTLQRSIAGVSARDVLGRPGSTVGIEAAKRVAEAAYKLHRAGVRPERRHDIGDELAILRRRLLGLAARHPPLSKRLKRLLRACETVAARLPEAAPTGIHRDFYPDQILMGAERLYLLDLDLYCLGDPALDLGNFVGHLSEQALRAHADPDALLEAEEALIEAYERLSGACIRPAVQVYKTLTLARHIELSTRLAGRGAFTEALLELCERRLEPIQADTPAPPDPVPPDPVPPDKDRAENAPDAL